MLEQFYIQDRNDWYIGRWVRLWAAKDPLPHDLKNEEFGKTIRVFAIDPQHLFDHLKHGDEKHQEWLKTEIFKYFETGSQPTEAK